MAPGAQGVFTVVAALLLSVVVTGRPVDVKQTRTGSHHPTSYYAKFFQNSGSRAAYKFDSVSPYNFLAKGTETRRQSDSAIRLDSARSNDRQLKQQEYSQLFASRRRENGRIGSRSGEGNLQNVRNTRRLGQTAHNNGNFFSSHSHNSRSEIDQSDSNLWNDSNRNANEKQKSVLYGLQHVPRHYFSEQWQNPLEGRLTDSGVSASHNRKQGFHVQGNRIRRFDRALMGKKGSEPKQHSDENRLRSHENDRTYPENLYMNGSRERGRFYQPSPMQTVIHQNTSPRHEGEHNLFGIFRDQRVHYQGRHAEDPNIDLQLRYDSNPSSIENSSNNDREFPSYINDNQNTGQAKVISNDNFQHSNFHFPPNDHSSNYGDSYDRQELQEGIQAGHHYQPENFRSHDRDSDSQHAVYRPKLAPQSHLISSIQNREREFFQQKQHEENKFATEFLQQFGYINDKKDENEFRHGLLKFQEVYGLNQTGHVTNEVMEAMHEPRCGMKDFLTEDELTAMKDVQREMAYRKRQATRSSRYHPVVRESRSLPDELAVYSRWWFDCDITWRLINSTDKLSNSYVRNVISDALGKWEKAVNLGRFIPALTFREERFLPYSHLKIGFNDGYHGDVLPFDGPGPSVAHSFYPYISGFWNGHVHFDNYEDWTTNSKVGRLLPLIALHELGHALGLPHNLDSRAVMYPVLDKRTVDSFEPHDVDIQAIQERYPYRLCDYHTYINRKKREVSEIEAKVTNDQ